MVSIMRPRNVLALALLVTAGLHLLGRGANSQSSDLIIIPPFKLTQGSPPSRTTTLTSGRPSASLLHYGPVPPPPPN